MTDNTEFERVIYVQNGQEVIEKIVNVRLDLTQVLAYSHTLYPVTGNLNANATEVHMMGLTTPFYLNIKYSEFHNLIEAL